MRARHAIEITTSPSPIVVASRNGTAISDRPTRRKTEASSAEIVTATSSVRMIDAIEARIHRSENVSRTNVLAP